MRGFRLPEKHRERNPQLFCVQPYHQLSTTSTRNPSLILRGQQRPSYMIRAGASKGTSSCEYVKMGLAKGKPVIISMIFRTSNSQVPSRPVITLNIVIVSPVDSLISARQALQELLLFLVSLGSHYCLQPHLHQFLLHRIGLYKQRRLLMLLPLLHPVLQPHPQFPLQD